MRYFIKHKKPCAECPWRRKAPAGYLGGIKIENFVNPVKFGMPIPCHLSTSEDAMCAGAAIVMKNSCTVPRDQGDAEQVDLVERSSDCFQYVHEFEDYHSRGLLYDRDLGLRRSKRERDHGRKK